MAKNRLLKGKVDNPDQEQFEKRLKEEAGLMREANERRLEEAIEKRLREENERRNKEEERLMEKEAERRLARDGRRRLIFGDMYARWTLDCLIELAYAVSSDFINRPHLYYSDDIPREIVDLRISYGTHPDFPNTKQRLFMHLPTFGGSDALLTNNMNSAFHESRKVIIGACIDYSERVYESGLPMLKARIRTSVVPLDSHFKKNIGRSAEASALQSKRIFDLAVEIIRCPGVAKVFGIEAAHPDWPLGSDDPNGAKLVEAIGMTLGLPAEYALTHEKFIKLQLVARKGRDALKLFLQPDIGVFLRPDPPNDPSLESLVTKVYDWGNMLEEYISAA